MRTASGVTTAGGGPVRPCTSVERAAYCGTSQRCAFAFCPSGLGRPPRLQPVQDLAREPGQRVELLVAERVEHQLAYGPRVFGCGPVDGLAPGGREHDEGTAAVV